MQRLERQRALIALVDRQGDLTLEEACRHFEISPATARRDFVEIAARGAAEKTWGGLRRRAGAAASGGGESVAAAGTFVLGEMVPTQIREVRQAEEKERIAREACALVKDGDVLTIDGGTTTLRMAPHLANRPVHIFTNSILIAHHLDRLRTTPNGAQVFLTGGFLLPHSGVVSGPQAVEALGRHHAHWAFLSVGGLDAEGATNTNQLVVETARAMMRSAEKSVVLADSSKWGKRDMVRGWSWREIAMLVTDAPPPADVAARVAEQVEVRVAR